MRLTYVSAFALAGILTLSACSSDNNEKTTQPAPYVLSAQVEQGFYEQWSLVGQVEPQSQATLGFQVSGEVNQRLVNPGSQVETGQVLLKLDPTDLTLKRRAAQANLNATEAELNLAKIEAQRAEDLLDRKLVSQQDYDRAQNQVTTLQQRLVSLQRELDLVKRQLAYTELKAPAPGLVQNVMLDKGDIAQVGQPAVELIYTIGLDVLVEIPESRIQNLPKAAQAKLSEQSDTIEVTLRELTPKTQGAAKTWQARYNLPLSIDQVRLGQTAELQFGQQQNLLKVPLSAVFDQAEGQSVWLIRNDQVERQPVKVVHITSDYALIEADLQPTDRVVKAGVHLLKQGQAVREREL